MLHFPPAVSLFIEAFIGFGQGRLRGSGLELIDALLKFRPFSRT
jgi:hypothetical protein